MTVALTIGVIQKFHVKAMAGAVEVPVTTQMVFTSNDPTKATVVATGLQDCSISPISANADGSPAPVTINAHLPASSAYSAGDGAQDGNVNVQQISALIFTPV